jgi:recombination protein RecA
MKLSRTIPREVGLETMSHTREANRLKSIKLLPLEKEVIVGCLIGDGSLEKSGEHYRLRIGHTIRHRDYVRWKYNLLQRICITEPRYVPATRSLRIGTIGHPELSEIRYKWYLNGVKTIPLDFKLTPLMIAIWFMDDGCKQGKSVDFSVHCFSEESIEILRENLVEFGIETTVIFDGKDSRIYVRRRSYDCFENLVKPYIQKCMAYKLP